MNEQAMNFTTEEKGIFHCQKGYKYAPLKQQSNRPSTIWGSAAASSAKHAKLQQ